jgi:hypothetical protein
MQSHNSVLITVQVSHVGVLRTGGLSLRAVLGGGAPFLGPGARFLGPGAPFLGQGPPYPGVHRPRTVCRRSINSSCLCPLCCHGWVLFSYATGKYGSVLFWSRIFPHRGYLVINEVCGHCMPWLRTPEKCKVDSHYDTLQGRCVADNLNPMPIPLSPAIPNCSIGTHYSASLKQCVADTWLNCELGSHYDTLQGRCVELRPKVGDGMKG